MSSDTGRTFLVLQGPPGPFFAQLGAGLRALGHKVLRVNFNGGDWLDWPGRAVNFTKGLNQWPEEIEALIERESVTDIILFGDCRPLHAMARQAARRNRVAVHVFEEGYIRPDWVTLERGGVNGHSLLPRRAEDYLGLATYLPPVPDYPPIPASFGRRAREALGYFAAGVLLTPLFRGYRSHRPFAATAEFGGWLARLLLRPVARLRSTNALQRLGGRPYFIVPLQLDSDHQIRTHSPFEGMTEAIETIVASFAEHAPKQVMLLIKEHPLDNGLRAWRRVVRRIAARHAVARRVLFIEHGHIDALVAAAVGVVTVNSTTGTLALASGTPVAVLGRAVYDLPGVTHQGLLDSFWSAPAHPQLEIYEAFRRVLVSRCLLRGGFSSVAGRAQLVPAAIERLDAARLLDDRVSRERRESVSA